ncbi:MAG TPA: ABC transporter ATP-binding protein [Acidobacteriaceae bacterium]|nr:ABC transporter ATP-binding protein [Acidobacteriaceae bacterium]
MAIRLLRERQRFAIAWLTAERIAVGVCDLAVAAAMYLLFLLLQGHVPAHRLWRIPTSTLSVAWLTAGLIALRAGTDVYSARSCLKQIQNLHTDLLSRLTKAYAEMQWMRFVRCNRSELAARALNTTQEAADFYHRCIELTSSVAIVLIIAAALVYQSAVAACAFACALGAFYAVHRFGLRNKLQTAAAAREASLRGLRKDVADMLAAGKEIRVYKNAGFFHSRIASRARSAAAANLRVVFLPQIARTVADQGAVLIFIAMIIAAQFGRGDRTHLVSLLAFYFVLSRRLLPLISQISMVAGQMEGSFESVQVVTVELEECGRARTVPQVARLPEPAFALELERVSFSFEPEVRILNAVSLRLRKGEVAVLQGASGIGKTSLLNVIAGLATPDSGVVRVAPESIAYVPQEITLLDDSIRNNLLFGLASKSDEDLMAALAVACLGEFVAAQPRGLETGVGDNGALFSGGQRQRLGVARAILRGGELLLLDEATSALDEESERQVLRNLSESGRTVFLVTHRPQACQFADRVFSLQNGSLVEVPGYGLTAHGSSPATFAVSPT